MSLPELTPPWKYFALINGDTLLPDGRVVSALADTIITGSELARESYVDDSIDTHVNTGEPHPSYDDMPSLTLLFENGLV